MPGCIAPDRPEPLVRAELADDLSAASETQPGVTPSWIARPSVLRRVAAAVSDELALDVDRLVVAGPGAMAIGTAVSMTSGLPFCTVSGSEIDFGVVYPAESVAVLTVDGSADEALRLLRARGATISSVIAIGLPAESQASDGTTVLFIIAGGRYLPAPKKGRTP